ncbi:hypothetical protein BKI52_02205 [marine bacterium AO1-C]|nr:hypothetical protein BKI52_02205 [marine bacterium AO1-C]
MLGKYHFKFCVANLIKLLAIFLSIETTYSQTSSFFTKAYNSNETNASQTNLCAAQSFNGDLLFANIRGLLTFNGKSWKLNQAKDLENNLIKFSFVYPVSNEKIYAGSTNDIGYWQAQNEGYKFVSLLKKQERKKEFNIITQIIEFKGLVFFMSFQKIFVTNGKKLLKIIETEKNNQFAYLYIIQNKLYVSKFGSIELWNEDKQDFISTITHQFGEINSGRGAVSILLHHYNNQLFSLFFKQGLWAKSDTGQFNKVPFPENVETVFKEGVRRAQMYDPHTILFSTPTKMYLFNIATKKLTKVFQSSSLIFNFYVDKNKNIWLTNNENIIHIEVSLAFKYYLKGMDVRWAISNKDGVFLGGVGKKEHLYWLKPTQELVPLGFNKPVNVLCTLGQDKLLVGTTSEIFLVDYLNNNKITKVYTTSGLYRVNADFQNFIYISFRGKTKIMKLINNQLREVGEIEYNNDNTALSILRKKDELWLGFNESGVIRYELKKQKPIKFEYKERYSTSNGDFKGTDTESNIILNEGKIIVYNRSGVYEFNDQTRKFTKIDIYGISPTKKGYTYLLAFGKDKFYATGRSNRLTSFGVAQKKEERYEWNSTPFLRLPSLEMRGLMSHHDKLYAATSKGLFIFDPQKIKDYSFHFPARINAAVDTNQITQDTTIAYNARQLTFNYSIPFFEAPEKLQYSYKLLGFNNEWSAWSTETKKEYTNLREGQYTFLVRAKNVYDVVSKESSFQFTVSPPWYRTGWAYAGYVLTGLLFLWGAIRINSYRLRKQKQRLEAEVARQTHEILEQKEEISQQAEELKTSNEKLAELSSFRESLSHMLVHDAKQPLTPLINFEHIQVRRAAKQVLSMLENILEVQKFESNEVVITPEAVVMGDLIDSVINQIKDLADEKLINIKNRIPLQAVIRADASYISRVFTNLLGNAIKYIPANSTVQLEAEEMPQDKQLKIWIKDNGLGIPDAHKTSIFEKFGRIDKKDQRSTGLGLAFCKLAVEAHEGEIGVLTISETQALGQSGAWFYFTLPLISNEAQATQNGQTEVTNQQNLVNQEFTEQDRVLIKSYIPQLSEIDFYDAGKIMILLQNRDWVGSSALEAWIERIPFTDDETHYQQMLKVFE